jgi:hypothetical protein
LIRNRGPSTKSTDVGSAKTNTSGRFTRSFTANEDGYRSAVWWTPNRTWVSAFSPEDFVDVR